MAKTKKVWALRPTDRLWGAIRVWALIFMGSAAILCGLLIHKAVLLSAYSPDEFMTQDTLVGPYAETIATGLAVMAFLLAYFVSAFLVLRWYLRSVRNARTLHRGIETSPAWVVWYFIIPVLSLFRPYSMTSELWRSCHRPDAWKGMNDPVLLRWWWGLVLTAGFVAVIGDLQSRAIENALQLQISTGFLAAAYGLQALAGVLFLRIGGPISRLQTALIASSPAVASEIPETPPADPSKPWGSV